MSSIKSKKKPWEGGKDRTVDSGLRAAADVDFDATNVHQDILGNI